MAELSVHRKSKSAAAALGGGKVGAGTFTISSVMKNDLSWCWQAFYVQLSGCWSVKSLSHFSQKGEGCVG